MREDAHQKVKPSHLKRTAYLYIANRRYARSLKTPKAQSDSMHFVSMRLLWAGSRIRSWSLIPTWANREPWRRRFSATGNRSESRSRRYRAWVGGIAVSPKLDGLASLAGDLRPSDTLILDEDGTYDPAHFNDRLLLGLKGTMSEAELHVLRARLQGGILNKARRGELFRRPPIGFAYDACGRLLLDPDQQIQRTIRMLFDTFQ